MHRIQMNIIKVDIIVMLKNHIHRLQMHRKQMQRMKMHGMP